jgi:hypothetical protein
MPRRFFRRDNWEFGGEAPRSEEAVSPEPKSRKRRLATTLAFTSLFFAGASLAAVAGDQLSPYVMGDDSASQALSADDSTTSTDATTTDAAPADDAATASAGDATAPVTDDPAAADPAATSDPAADGAVAPDTSTADADPSAPTAESLFEAATDDSVKPQSSPSAGASATQPAGKRPAKKSKSKRNAQLRKQEKLEWALLPKTKPAPEPEIEGPKETATIWLNSPLPDPTPPALRLSSKFAANLKKAAKSSGVDWAVMLGVLRARGATGHFPATRSTLDKLGARLGSHGPTKGAWATIVAYSGDTDFSDKAAALARYNRAVGLKALVKGLESQKKPIASKLLSDRMVDIYPGGQDDIVNDKVDVRVLAMIAYLRASFGQVTVTSLISGHRLYARPGVVSAHIPGHAVDIAALDETPILGHQEPGGITERAVRDILMAPAEIMPRQVISLLGLGGPSFPLADHYNHIHIGY